MSNFVGNIGRKRELGLFNYKLYVVVLRNNSVAPQILELIELAGFRVKDVDHDIEIIKADPIGVPATGSGFRQFTEFVLHPFLDVACNRGYLGSGLSSADEEEVSGAVVEFPQVNADDFFSLDVLNAVQDKREALLLRSIGQSRCRSRSGTQINRLAL